MPDEDRVLVYSTDGSLPLPKTPRKTSAAGAGRPALPDDDVIRVGCERRRGGSMTLVYGLPTTQLQRVGKALKRRCGAGGTTKEGILELQGDHRDVILAHLAEQGYRVKRMGG